MKRILCLASLLALLLAVPTACEKDIEPVTPGKEQPAKDPDPSDPDTPGEDDPDSPNPDEPTNYSAKDGVAYMFDGVTVPKIHVEVSLEEWNKLLGYYDEDSNTSKSVVCSVEYDKAGEVTAIDSVAIRLRGNTSRRRPEGSGGQMHVKDNTDWHHCHFQLNFRKFVKDESHELHGARKVILKWFKDDPMYVREVFCYDLFRQYGVWTGANSAYCQLYIHVEGDSKETYYGVYEMVEPIDERFIKVRKEQFGSTGGFLWKCRWGATLSSTDRSFGADDGSGKEYTYELKNDIDQYETAEAQIKDFIAKVQGKGDESFAKWFPTVCDVPLLLKTYAVNVAVGMWDDYWNNCNNYYIYFNSTDRYEYQFYFLPYDYDNTLGTSASCGAQSDSGRQNPLQWGQDSNPLIARVLKIDEYKKLYKQYLLELVDKEDGLMYYETSIARINAWHNSINGMVSNDTGEDTKIEDKPASWGNHSEYRLLDTGSNNFFKVKAQTIEQYCK